ncbi:hypothetical protein LOAG_08118 [Loa loa]|uniref:Uncharacterized protein n=1 Tax=Loa loa TaxID=7209 RepID=A0A1S0TVW9_LOALO|nr:hypothetical protein LOAG_08118 [Loa loa]EFO20371.1 hypothetical protein LOAG_08118 [Loa loa]
MFMTTARLKALFRKGVKRQRTNNAVPTSRLFRAERTPFISTGCQGSGYMLHHQLFSNCFNEFRPNVSKLPDCVMMVILSTKIATGKMAINRLLLNFVAKAG